MISSKLVASVRKNNACRVQYLISTTFCEWNIFVRHNETVHFPHLYWTPIGTYGVRLVSGTDQYPLEGRVEINFHGQWGTVCGDSWDNTDAAVVCNQLGFTGSSTARRGVHGQGSGTIWLTDVQCTEDDQSLAECAHSGWGISTCDHSQDAGVICTSASDVGKFFISFAYKLLASVIEICRHRLYEYWIRFAKYVQYGTGRVST